MTDKDNDVNYTLPSNPEDRKKIKSLLQEISAQYQMIDDRKAAIKDVVDSIKEQYSIPKKIVTKLAKTVYKHNYDEVAQDSDLFKLYYEEIVDKQQVIPPSLSNAPTGD